MMPIEWLDKERLAKAPQFGTFLNLGSSLSAELAAAKGFDWLLVDTEHGAGDFADMVRQLQAIGGWPVSPIVRVLWNDAQLIKRTLDAGAAGIMIPYVSSAHEASAAVAAMRYPPAGNRGAAGTTRATGFGTEMVEYHSRANDRVTTIVQLESPEAVGAADEIAAVDGVDVLFVGPLDLSFNLGEPRNYESDAFSSALVRVVAACDRHQKTPGILASAESAERFRDLGFRFIGIGSDGHCLNVGLDRLSQLAGRLRSSE